ncbi:GNAT family N-acetyltransferase [Actinomadura monticuli]|uniref:GNAT family protein n=1 Tax=Actinomadura monticuli TaxID=3097367 RepID=A0ABV4QF71_9ACTN
MTRDLSRSGMLARQITLHGKRVVLRPVEPTDYDFILQLSTSSHITYRWRTRGTTPSPPDFQAMLWRGVLCQFLIERSSDGEPLGLISAYNADFRNQTAYLAILMRDHRGGAIWTFDGMALFLNYLFANFNLRKIYAETSELSSWTFASGAGRYFEVEGTLREHEYYGGRYWDTYVLAFWRHDCESFLEKLLPTITEEPPTDGRPATAPARPPNDPEPFTDPT